MASVYISDKAVVEVVPYASRHTLLRLDVGPFALLYFAIYACIWEHWPLVLQEGGWSKVVVLVALPVVLMCHLLLFLSTQWSIRFSCVVSQWRVASIDVAENVRVVPAKHCGSEELVPLRRRRGHGVAEPKGATAPSVENTESSVEIAGNSFVLPELWFVFQQTKFVFSKAGGKEGFLRLEYPSEGSFQSFLGCRGVKSEADLAVREELWGCNVLDIPMPKFTELFAEHAVAPFFVFQVLCVTLWSLDDYWYYALFTLVMLVLFEAMLCIQRQRNLEMLRSMRREPTLVYTLRAGRWRRVSSEQVAPGEVISLVARPPTVASAMQEAQRRGGQRAMRSMGVRGGGTAASMGLDIMSADGASRWSGGGGVGDQGGAGAGDEEALAPFDVLLMRGSCVVNEAMLTGESVPQAKTSLVASGGGSGGGAGGGEAWLKVEDGTDSAHRKHVIFSGTKVLQHSDGSDDAISAAGAGVVGGEMGDLLAPPDKGCPCVVLRTGFETSQGQLMKTILFATERVTAGSDAETGVFLLILLVFAAVASAFVLKEGLADETRNPFKLVLHCIMILTSVIPPELPIELSLAVINSLTALTQSLIFCTEPFRIPLAGKVSVCCFDKTGTLTSDNLVMKGVAGAPGNGGPGGGNANTSADSCPVDEFSPTAPSKETAGVGVLGEVPTRILAGCHSLVTLNGTLVGDSVEVSTLKGLGWACLRGGVVVPRAVARAARAATTAPPDATLQPIQIVRSWQFDPSLRRMCTAIRLVSDGSGSRSGPAMGAIAGSSPNTGGEGNGGGVPPFHDRLWIVAKGAPESLEPLLTDAPPNYRSTYLHHMGQGSRVLALAYRDLDPKVDGEGCRRLTRAAVERGLRFGGFLVLGCPLKPDAPYVVRELRESSHAVAMITGDSVLTAADVARQVGMIDQSASRTLVLEAVRGVEAEASPIPNRRENSLDAGRSKDGGGRVAVRADGERKCSLHWVSLTADFDGGKGKGIAGGDEGDNSGIPFDAGSLGTLAERHALCVTGDVLTRISATALPIEDTKTIPTSSDATTKVLGNAKGSLTSSEPSALSTLCSHVTVFARVSPAQKEQVIGELNAAGSTTLMCGDGTNDVGALRLAHVGVSIVNSPELEKRLEIFLGGEGGDQGGSGGGGGRKKSQRSAEAKRSRMLASREREEQDLDPALVKLGDASIASPFTAKTTSVGCVLAIIRQGRCTLVTTLQVYKILALNCLTSAYMLSALYLVGVKQGDGQMTILGLAISALFYCASRSQPLRRLSSARPPARIFCLQACMSVLGQFVVHLVALLAVTWLCEGHVNSEDPSVMPDGPFRPNTFNTAVFLLSAVMQVNTFAANYTGHPFMQSLRENRPMCWLVVGSYASILAAASGLAPALEGWLQLVPFPEGFREPFLAVLAADTALVFLVEKSTGWLTRRLGQGVAKNGGSVRGTAGRGRGGGGAKRRGGKRKH